MPTYLITGASRGLGLETARQLLAADPAILILAAARNPSTASSLQELIKANPERIAAVTLDVGSEASIKSGIAEAEAHPFTKNGLDVLWNNAGIIVGGSDGPSVTPTSELDEMLNVNLHGPIRTVAAALPLLRKGAGQKIYTASSIMGSMASPQAKQARAAFYSVTKAAVNMYCVKLAAELEPEKFAVILYHPGYVKTEMNKGGGVLTPEDSVQQTIATLLPKTAAESGKFYAFSGEELPW